MVATVAALDAFALVASNLPNVNPPTPIYAIVASDTFIPLTIPSSWGEFSPKYETAMSDYPQEQGAFQPFNKVRRPWQVRVTLVKTGSDLARAAWLTAIQQQEASAPTQLYTLISPQGIFVDYALAGMAYETRKERGSNMLYLNLQFGEIPLIASANGTYSSPVEAKSGPVQQIGRVFTQAASAAQSALINAQTFILG